MSRYQHGYSWPSLAISPYRPLLPSGLQDYILYRHRAAACKFELVVLPLLIHGKGDRAHKWCTPVDTLTPHHTHIYIYTYIYISTDPLESLFGNTPAQTQFRQHSFKQAAKGIGLSVNSDKIKFVLEELISDDRTGCHTKIKRIRFLH